jgi:hypothetical protein
MNVKKTVLALSATVAALALAPAANAAVVDPIILSGNPLTDSFGGVADGAIFSDVFNFVLPSNGNGAGSATTIEIKVGEIDDVDIFANIDFSTVVLKNLDTLAEYDFSVVNDGPLSIAALGTTFLYAGNYSLTVSGSSDNGGSYGGQFSVAPVPEPATWALMIAGLGVVGMAMRRRSSAKRNVAVSFV